MFQFSLRAVLIVVTGAAVLLAIAAQFPRWAAFVVLMTGLVLFPLLAAAVLRVILVRMRLAGEYWPWQRPGSGKQNLWARPGGVLRFLGLAHVEEGPSLGAAAVVAALSTLAVVGLWPMLREVGLQMAIAINSPEIFTWELAARSIRECATSSRYWWRLWQWELWSLGRWWILFGAMTAIWTAVSAVAGRRDAFLARLLAFAPWLVVLEMTFLVGVWISSPNTVPEPSTGFVVGIFSWDLWRWGCWLDREWLIRGVVPTLVAGFVFFARVLRWPWPVAAVAAAALVPLALMLSVATTVAWQRGLPWP